MSPLGLQQLKEVILNNDSIRSLIESPNTLAMLSVGSIPKEQFIDGWSDIDLFLIYEHPNLEYFRLINNTKIVLENHFHTKSGIELISQNQIDFALQNTKYVGNYIKLAKNLNLVSSSYKKGIIYCKEKYTIPTFDISSLLSADPIPYVSFIDNYMTKLITENYRLENKPLIRKIIKNVLFIMQMDLISFSSIFEEDFEQVLTLYTRKYTDINCTAIVDNFSKKNHWSKISNLDISQKDIEDCWKVLSVVISKIHSNVELRTV